jgi:DNA-binding NtrC family response regulator
MRRLMSYAWPGNVRQLENATERAMAFGGSRGQIEAADLPPEVAGAEPPRSAISGAPDDGMDLDAFVASIERELIQRRSSERAATKVRPQSCST